MSRSSFALSLFALVACGDNDEVIPPGGPDGSMLADAAPAMSRAVVVSGDFAATGVLSTLDLPARAITPNAVVGIAGIDPVIRKYGDEIFVINRFGGDNVTIISAETLALVDQISTGADSNPQDVAVVGDKLYVPALGTAGVLVIDRANSNATSTIDLADLDANDDLPDCISAYTVGTRVFVACGLLDGFAAVVPGRVAVIDSATDTSTTDIALPAINPFGWFAPSPSAGPLGGDLLIAHAPSFEDFSSGCLARVSTGNTPAATCAITNSELGGYANRVAASSEGSLLWIVVDGDAEVGPGFMPYGRLRGYDIAGDFLWDGGVSPESQLIVDLAVCQDNQVVVADRPMTGPTGLRVYDSTTEVTTAPLDIGMPPAFGNAITCFAR
jgi:hypothetical protein